MADADAVPVEEDVSEDEPEAVDEPDDEGLTVRVEEPVVVADALGLELLVPDRECVLEPVDELVEEAVPELDEDCVRVIVADGVSLDDELSVALGEEDEEAELLPLALLVCVRV